MRILGIDPGRHGALALLDTTAGTLALLDMPLEPAGKSKFVTSPVGLAQAIRRALPDAVVCEEVHAMPGQGVVSMFSFGCALGVVLGAASAMDVMLTRVRQQVWKSAMKVGSDKRLATTRAAQLLPHHASSFIGKRGGCLDGRAEAALLALYGALSARQGPTKPLGLAAYPSDLQLAA